jgi:hypothetical protein
MVPGPVRVCPLRSIITGPETFVGTIIAVIPLAGFVFVYVKSDIMTYVPEFVMVKGTELIGMVAATACPTNARAVAKRANFGFIGFFIFGV